MLEGDKDVDFLEDVGAGRLVLVVVLARRRQAHDLACPLLPRPLLGGQLDHGEAWEGGEEGVAGESGVWRVSRWRDVGGSERARERRGVAQAHRRCRWSCQSCTPPARSRPCASCAPCCGRAAGASAGREVRRRRWRPRQRLHQEPCSPAHLASAVATRLHPTRSLQKQQQERQSVRWRQRTTAAADLQLTLESPPAAPTGHTCRASPSWPRSSCWARLNYTGCPWTSQAGGARSAAVERDPMQMVCRLEMLVRWQLQQPHSYGQCGKGGHRPSTWGLWVAAWLCVCPLTACLVLARCA